MSNQLRSNECRLKKKSIDATIPFPYEAHGYFSELICLEVAAHTGYPRRFGFGFDQGRYHFGSHLDHQNDLKDEGCRGRANLPLIS